MCVYVVGSTLRIYLGIKEVHGIVINGFILSKLE